MIGSRLSAHASKAYVTGMPFEKGLGFDRGAEG
jgi:hypothetical protein